MAILMRALQDLSAHGVATTTLTYSDAHIAICLLLHDACERRSNLALCELLTSTLAHRPSHDPSASPPLLHR